jgi:serine protease Do
MLKGRPMARWRPGLVIAMGWLAVGGLAPGQAYSAQPSRDAPAGFADLVDRLLPAVVNVATVHEAPEGAASEVAPLGPGVPLDDLFRDLLERQRRLHAEAAPRHNVVAIGSGFIIDPAGWIVTNDHVVSDSSRIRVTLYDGTSLTARLIGHDARMDLALLKVETRKPLHAVAWGASDSVRVGDWVLTIGNPFGLVNSVAAGIVSGRNRDLHTGPYDEYIQTDAAMNTGNSGGPMFDLSGRVIGIDTAIYTQTGGSVGVGFAIPSSQAEPVIEQLRKTGRITRGFIGVRLESVTDDVAKLVALDTPRGALVTQLAPDGPAAGADLHRGDVIVAVGAEPIASVRQLQRLIAALPVDQVAHVTVWRDHKELALDVRIAEYPEAGGQATPAAQPTPEPTPVVGELLGLSLAPITDAARQTHALGAHTLGVAVTDVVPSSPAEDAGLMAGDVILELDGNSVATPEDAAQRLHQATATRRKSVLVLVDRDGERQFVAMRTS